MTIGWREWVSLPALGLSNIKAKIDTGARTSTLHAFLVEPFTREQTPWVRFSMHPLQKKINIIVHCEAPILDQRWVTDSGGHKEQRYVISTALRLGSACWDIEITLTNRENMKFRMLLGRTAMNHKVIIDPTRSYLVGKKPVL